MIEYYFVCKMIRSHDYYVRWRHEPYTPNKRIKVIRNNFDYNDLSLMIFPLIKWQEEFISGIIHCPNIEGLQHTFMHVAIGNSEYYKEGKFITPHEIPEVMFEVLEREYFKGCKDYMDFFKDDYLKYKEKYNKLNKYKERLKNKIKKLEDKLNEHS